MQVCTGAIGLQRFLFRRQVPGFPTLLYSCSKAPETVAHLLIRCQQPEIASGCLPIHNRHKMLEALQTREGAARIVT